MRAAETVRLLRVIVASPADVSAERDCVSRVLEEMNRTVAKERGLRLEPWRWEVDSYPGFHAEGPQDLADCVDLSRSG